MAKDGSSRCLRRPGESESLVDGRPGLYHKNLRVGLCKKIFRPLQGPLALFTRAGPRLSLCRMADPAEEPTRRQSNPCITADKYSRPVEV